MRLQRHLQMEMNAAVACDNEYVIKYAFEKDGDTYMGYKWREKIY